MHQHFFVTIHVSCHIKKNYILRALLYNYWTIIPTYSLWGKHIWATWYTSKLGQSVGRETEAGQPVLARTQVTVNWQLNVHTCKVYHQKVLSLNALWTFRPSKYSVIHYFLFRRKCIFVQKSIIQPLQYFNVKMVRRGNKVELRLYLSLTSSSAWSGKWII